MYYTFHNKYILIYIVHTYIHTRTHTHTFYTDIILLSVFLVPSDVGGVNVY